MPVLEANVPGVAQEGTFYSVIGGIDCLIQAGEHFAAAVRRRPDLLSHLAGAELQWLQVRLVQLLASSAGGPVDYTGPRLHQLYAQHLLPPTLHSRLDELVMQAMYQAHISRVFLQVLVGIARDGEAEGVEETEAPDQHRALQ